MLPRVLAALMALGLVLAAAPASASYRTLPLREIVLLSDAIVAGSIIELRADTFVLRVESGGFGANAGDTIEVRRFEDWTCAERWTSYAVGQRVLLFLAQRNGRWTIQGAGDEGEMPIDGAYVHVPGVYAALAPPGVNPYRVTQVMGGRFGGFRVELAALLEAITLVRRCWRGTAGVHGYVARTEATCTPETLARERASASVLGRAMITAVESAH